MISYAYKKVAGVELQLRLFWPKEIERGEARPGIVFFFGGGWRVGSIEQFLPHCRHLSRRGMIAAVADYRVESRHGTTPREAVADAKSCIRWLRAQAKALLLDPDRLAAGGGSAGGHLAAACAALPGLDDPSDDLGVSCRPDALVLFNPVVDNSPEGYGSDRFGEQWRDISPLHNLTAPAPPSCFFLGMNDHLVPVAVGEAYRARVAELGGRCDLHLFPGQGHGFFNFQGGKNPYFGETLREMDDFLASLGYLESYAAV